MTPRLRKLTLTAHVTLSVGWLGAVAAYIALAIAALVSQNEPLVRASYLSMEVIAWFVILWLGCGALLTGLVQSLGTEWGLFRHYWIAIKFALTVLATLVLVMHVPTISRVARAAAEPGFLAQDSHVRVQLLVHAVGGLVVLLVVTALSVFKPWGRTPYGRRKQRESTGP